MGNCWVLLYDMLEDNQIDTQLAHPAKAAVARTLAKVIWHMLTNEAEYRTQNKKLTHAIYEKSVR